MPMEASLGPAVLSVIRQVATRPTSSLAIPPLDVVVQRAHLMGGAPERNMLQTADASGS